ncbi:MAG: RluA family pseudouridine synthase [Candidatus Kapaibacterium sp.]
MSKKEENKNYFNHYPDYEEDIIVLNVPSGKVPERIDTYLSTLIKNASRTRVRKSLDEGMVKVNGNIIKKASYKITGDDIIECIMLRRPPVKLVPQEIPLDIVFEDNYLLVVNKPAGMVVHPGVGNRYDTLVNAVLFHLGITDKIEIDFNDENADDEVINDPGKVFASDEVRPGIVHRLDKNTSGLLVVAKTTEVLSLLQAQFADRTVSRTYNAIAWGTRLEDEGSIIGNIDRSPIDRKKFAVSTKSGKYAKTNFKVLKRYSIATLIELKLETGRTHQIRVHLTHHKHPIIGDEDYGGNINNYKGVNGELNNLAKFIISRSHRQLLHAKNLQFIHPITNEKMQFTSKLPEDMVNVINILDSSHI